VVDRVNLELLVRDGCHLCEEAISTTQQVLEEVGEGFPATELDLRLIDVDSDPELLERYSDEVPVLLVNGEQRAFWRIDEERLRAHLIQILA
jgi:glutaredoxin